MRRRQCRRCAVVFTTHTSNRVYCETCRPPGLTSTQRIAALRAQRVETLGPPVPDTGYARCCCSTCNGAHWPIDELLEHVGVRA